MWCHKQHPCLGLGPLNDFPKERFIEWSQNKKFHLVAFGHHVVKKNSVLVKFCKTQGKCDRRNLLLFQSRSRCSAGNFQNLPFLENQEDIPMESISKSFDTDSPKSVLRQRYFVLN